MMRGETKVSPNEKSGARSFSLIDRESDTRHVPVIQLWKAKKGGVVFTDSQRWHILNCPYCIRVGALCQSADSLADILLRMQEEFGRRI